MFRLRIGYLISGIATGCIVLFSFVWTLPDGKLHVVFCDVGQGDAAYVRFPDGRDMLVDAGPNDRVLQCLGEYMPFWDRQLDIVALTHPQKDHMQGLIPVLERYNVTYFVRSDVANDTEGYKKLMEVVSRKKIAEKFVTTGQRITVGPVNLAVLWPSEEQIAKAGGTARSNLAVSPSGQSESVLGVTSGELNDYSLVFDLHYGTFDVLFTGDADAHIQPSMMRILSDTERKRGEVEGRALDTIEVLKVPHHGSKTGMTPVFLTWVKPQLAVISVGKNNSYGHPAKEIVKILSDRDIKIQRTDQEGDIEVVSDGKTWTVKTVRAAGSGGRR